MCRVGIRVVWIASRCPIPSLSLFVPPPNPPPPTPPHPSSSPFSQAVDASANDIGFVTYQMYGIVRDLVSACITQTPDVWEWTDEIALVGGIIINRKNGGDFFQPLSFETRTASAPPTDLYEEVFGQRPDLQPILGSNSVAAEVYGKETLSGLATSIRSTLPAL